MALKTGSPKGDKVNPDMYSIFSKRDKQVDWNKASGDITKELKRVEKERNLQRAADQKVFDDNKKNISQIDNSPDQTFNAVSLKYSQQMAENNMKAFEDVKNGRLSRTDFKIQQSNRQQTIATFSQSVKDYNKQFEDYTTRVQNDESSGVEQWNQKGLAGFGNMANVVMIDNSENGFGEMVTLTPEERLAYDADGTLPDRNKFPEKFVPATQITQRMNQKIDKANTIEAVAAPVDALGKTIEAYLGDETIVSKEDFLLRDDAKKMINQYAVSIAGNDGNISSILSDEIGGYEFTTDPNNTDPNKIKVGYTAQGELIIDLTEEQKNVAIKYTEDTIKSQLVQSQEIKERRGETAAELTSGRQDELAASYLNSIDMLITGTPEDADAGGQNLIDEVNKNRGKDAPEIKNITRTTDGNFIIETEDKTVTVEKGDPAKTPEQIRREIYAAVTPTGTVTYDAIRSGDLEGDIGAGTGGGTVGVEKVQWRRDPKIGDITFTTQDWVDTMPSLGDNLGMGDNQQEVKNQFTQLLNTNGFLPNEFRDEGQNEIVMDGNKMTVIIQGTKYPIDGNIMNYSTGDVVTRIQGFIEDEVQKRNKGISSGELD